MRLATRSCPRTRAIIGKHEIGKPYTDMRNFMIVGTILILNNGTIVIHGSTETSLPIIMAARNMTAMSCSSALTKLKRHLYQRELDLAKHGVRMGGPPAVSTLIKRNAQCYTLIGNQAIPMVVFINCTSSANSSILRTNMDYIGGGENSQEKFLRAVWCVIVVETIDGIKLRDEERVSVVALFAYVSERYHEVVAGNMCKPTGAPRAHAATSTGSRT